MTPSDKITVIDADYIVTQDDRVFRSSDRVAKKAVKSVARSMWAMVLWSVKQVGGLMMDGVRGTMDGIKDASEIETNRFEDSVRRRREKKKIKRPIWYIPSKEEEEYERYNGGGYR